MTVKAKASICLKFCDPKLAIATSTALKPEINSFVTHRANVALQIDDCFIVLNMVAEDVVALRAMANTYLRWIASIVNVIEVIERV